MSLFVVPQTGSLSWHASSLSKPHGAAKQMEVSIPVLGSAALGGATAVTVAAAVAHQSNRGSQKRGANINIRAFENELGVQAPVGFWDPLGLSKDGDAASFRRRRETELKHGRVAMIACIGYITPEFFRWPGNISPSQGLEFSSIPNGLQALSAVPGGGWVQMILFCLALEKGIFVQNPTRAPGDFENGGVLGVPNKSSMPAGEAKNRRLSAELANGRLAMMAIIGMFYQDGLTGSAWGDWSLYTDSPLRAFENELGVQAPIGFWDPLQYAADGDVAAFRRRRESEIKHGRISMIATIGYIIPGLGYRFGGLLSESKGIAFEQIPNGLQALKFIPAVGLAQFVLFCGFIETGLFKQDPERGPGDFLNGGILGVPNASGPLADAEERKRKLNAELANGRLAMMAIIGMFFQDGLTGSAWGDWASYTASPLRALETDRVAHAKTRGGSLRVFAAASSEAASTEESAFDMTLQNGVTAPTGIPGKKFWDPLGLAKDIDSSTFRQYRAAELKHGRFSMMALGGLIAQHFLRFPAYRSDPSGIQAATSGHESAAGLALILIFVGIVEYNTTDDGREPGDYGDPFDWINQLETFDPNKPEELLIWRNRELNHCRLAMVGFLGTVLAEYATGYDAVDQWSHSEQAWQRTLAILSWGNSAVSPLDSF